MPKLPKITLLNALLYAVLVAILVQVILNIIHGNHYTYVIEVQK